MKKGTNIFSLNRANFVRLLTPVLLLLLGLGLNLGGLTAGHPAIRGAAAMPNATLITLSATEDTTVSQGSPTANFGTLVTLFPGHDEFTQEDLALLKFNLSSIPAGATINSAKLRLNRTGAASSLAMNVGVQRVQGNWTEGAVTWNTRPAVSTSVIDSVTVPPPPPI